MNTERDDRAVEGSQDRSLYQEGVSLLQAGRWQEAIRCLEDAARQNPDDAEIQDALAEARYKAQFDASVAVRPLRWAVAWRKHLVRALVVVVIAAAAVLALQIFRQQVAPSVAAAQVTQQAAAAVREGKRYLEAGKLPAARRRMRRRWRCSRTTKKPPRGYSRPITWKRWRRFIRKGSRRRRPGTRSSPWRSTTRSCSSLRATRMRSSGSVTSGSAWTRTPCLRGPRTITRRAAARRRSMATGSFWH